MEITMSEDDLWIGIDLGTQSVKIVVVDNDGKIVAQDAKDLVSVRKDKIHEQDPAQWIKQTQSALRNCLKNVNLLNIRAVSTCSTSGTITVMNSKREFKAPGIMYDDQRAEEYTNEIIESDPAMWKKLGYQIQPTWALPKMLKLFRENKIEKDDQIVFQTDVISSSMAQQKVATDWSSALKSGFDLLELKWPEKAFNSLGINLENLPQVVGPGTIIGLSGKDWQEETGLPMGTKIVSGQTDGCAAQIGAGALSLGDWHSVIGTTLVLKGVSNKPIFDTTGSIYSHKAPHDDLWLPGGASSVGAGIISKLLPNANLDQLNSEILQSWNNSTEKWTINYPLSKKGERFPILNSEFAGFSFQAGKDEPLEVSNNLSPAQVLGSVYIGVAAVEKFCFEMLAEKGASLSGRLSSSGGAIKSEAWNKIRSTMLNKEIVIPASVETALGSAILARFGLSRNMKLPEISRHMNSTSLTIEPDSKKVNQLDDYYQQFKNKLKQLELI
jgi:sugar (pentulose or hexulose) kinase